MEIDIKQVRDRALDIISNTYHEKEVPQIEKEFLRWFDDKEGWYDVSVNTDDYTAQGVVTYFLENIYDNTED